MYAKFFLLVFFAAYIGSSLHHVRATEYKIRKLEGEKEKVAAQILELALSKVDSSVKLIEEDEVKTEARLVESIESNELDILWAGASQDKEERLLTVRIPILKGLLGHRIFVIRKADKGKFLGINSVKSLNQFKAGQGKFWGDTQVLLAAGINTVTTIKYHNLFPMLEGGRFDYFPRAVHEPWSEVEQHSALKLSVDEDVMLIYPYAMYFFVSKGNQALHDKIYQGFEKAIMDGSYDRLFFSMPMIKNALAKAKLSKRSIIRLENPFMHPDTPNERKEFWLDIDSLEN